MLVEDCEAVEDEDSEMLTQDDLDALGIADGLIEDLGADAASTWADGYAKALDSFGTPEAVARWQLIQMALAERAEDNSDIGTTSRAVFEAVSAKR